jgi:hypothetical protein
MFKWFVLRLDQLQGSLLREVSAAVSGIVKGIFEGTLDSSKRFGIELLDQEEVTKHPKGSPVILQSLSKTIPTTTEAAGYSG